MRRAIGLLLVLATVGIALGVMIAPGTPAKRATARHAPSINATAMPQTCFVAGGTCSLQPCVEFVARARSRSLGTRCTAYPSPRGRTVFLRR